MKQLLILLLALAPVPAAAQELHVLDLSEFSMEYYKIANNRDVYYPYGDPGGNANEHWDFGLAAKWDLDLLRYGDFGLHWRNRVEGQSTNHQFRNVSWQFRWGLQLGDRFEVFYDHVSSHLLDEAPADTRTYELRNFYGAELIFYRR